MRSATEAFPQPNRRGFTPSDSLGKQETETRTHIDAFRSEGFSSADSTRIHSVESLGEALSRNEDAKR